MRRLKPTSLLIAAIFFLTLTIVAVMGLNEASANESPIKIFRGDNVIKTNNGVIYIAKDVTITDNIIILKEIRHPVGRERLIIPIHRLYEYYLQE